MATLRIVTLKMGIGTVFPIFSCWAKMTTKATKANGEFFAIVAFPRVEGRKFRICSMRTANFSLFSPLPLPVGTGCATHPYTWGEFVWLATITSPILEHLVYKVKVTAFEDSNATCHFDR